MRALAGLVARSLLRPPRLARDERGQGLPEYALLLASVAVMVVGVSFLFGADLNLAVNRVGAYVGAQADRLGGEPAGPPADPGSGGGNGNNGNGGNNGNSGNNGNGGNSGNGGNNGGNPGNGNSGNGGAGGGNGKGNGKN